MTPIPIPAGLISEEDNCIHAFKRRLLQAKRDNKPPMNTDSNSKGLRPLLYSFDNFEENQKLNHLDDYPEIYKDLRDDLAKLDNRVSKIIAVREITDLELREFER